MSKEDTINIKFPYPKEYENIIEYQLNREKQEWVRDAYTYISSIRNDLICKRRIYNQSVKPTISIKRKVSHKNYEAIAYILQSGLLNIFIPQNSVSSLRIEKIDEMLLKPEYAIILLTDALIENETHLLYGSEEHIGTECALAIYILYTYKCKSEKMELSQTQIQKLEYISVFYHNGAKQITEDDQNSNVGKILQHLMRCEKQADEIVNEYENIDEDYNITGTILNKFAEIFLEIKACYLISSDNALSDEELEWINTEAEKVLKSMSSKKEYSLQSCKAILKIIFYNQLEGLIKFWLVNCYDEIINNIADEYNHAISMLKHRLSQVKCDEPSLNNICVKELQNQLDTIESQEVSKGRYTTFITSRADEYSKILENIKRSAQEQQCRCLLKEDNEKLKPSIDRCIKKILEEDLSLVIIDYKMRTSIKVPEYLLPIFNGVQMYYQYKPNYFGRRNVRRKQELLIPTNSIENDELWCDFVKVLSYLDFERDRLQENNPVIMVHSIEKENLFTNYWMFCFCSVYEIYKEEIIAARSDEVKGITDKLVLRRGNCSESEYALERIWGFALIDYEVKIIQQCIEEYAQDIIDLGSVESLKQRLNKMELKKTLSDKWTKNEIVDILLDIFFITDRKRIYMDIEEYIGVYQRLYIVEKKLPEYIRQELETVINDSEEQLLSEIFHDIRNESEYERQREQCIDIEQEILAWFGGDRINELKVYRYKPYDDFYDKILQYLLENLNIEESGRMKFYKNTINKIAKRYMHEQTAVRKRIMEYLLNVHEKKYKVSGLDI